MAKIDLKAAISTSVEQVYQNDKLIGSESIKRNIVVLEELENYIPALAKEELEGLEKSIIENGCRGPLIVWRAKRNMVYKEDKLDETPVYILIDGHNRYKICNKNNISFSIDLMDFKDIDAVKDFMIDLQVNRRNVTKQQASYLRGVRYNREKQINWSKKKLPNESKRTSEILAEQFKVSPMTIVRDGKYAQSLDLLPETEKREILIGGKKTTNTKNKNKESNEIKEKRKIGVRTIDLALLKGIIEIDDIGQYIIKKDKYKTTTDGIVILTEKK